jgi:hypothetical protein
MPSRLEKHYLASLQGKTNAGLVGTSTGKIVLGNVRNRVSLPDCSSNPSSADSPGTQFLRDLV